LQGFSFLLCLFTGILALGLVLNWPVEEWLQQLLKPSVVREDQLLPPPASENVLSAPTEKKPVPEKVLPSKKEFGFDYCCFLLALSCSAVALVGIILKEATGS